EPENSRRGYKSPYKLINNSRFLQLSISHYLACGCAHLMIGLGEQIRRIVVSAGSTKSYVNANEAELIRRVNDGDKEAFYELVHPYERAVFTAAMSILNNQADAEEASQEAVLKAFANISKFRAESKFSTWLIQIAINEARLKL